jgi:PAS domain S-box-containing protein
MQVNMKASSSNPVGGQMELRKLRLRCAQFEQRVEEQRRLAAELERERDGLRQLYDSLPVACMTLDANGILLEGNARAAALFGIEPAFLPGLKLASAVAVPQHVERLHGHIAAALGRADHQACELWLRRPGGSVIPVRLQSIALRERGAEAARCRTVILEVGSQPEPAVVLAPAPALSQSELERERELPLPAVAPANGSTVLVIEDESLVRKAVQHYLAAAGYHVLTASDGSEALARSSGHPGTIDLVLTDLSLAEGATGPEIVAELRKERPDVAVLYMSACPPELLARRGFLLPEGGTLEKPFGRETLLRRVANAMAPTADERGSAEASTA